MKNLTMSECLEYKDFEEAKERYEACRSNRWKNKWWEIVCEIWKATKRFAKKYVLDLVNKVILRVGEQIDVIDYTYWIRLYDCNNKTVFNKIGKSKDPLTRWEAILKERYCFLNGVVGYEVKKVWEIHNQWAEGLESYLRAMLIKNHGEYYVPTDRFACDIDETEIFGYAEIYLT